MFQRVGANASIDIVTDFGRGADRLDVSGAFDDLGLDLTAEEALALGHLRVTQDGANALVQISPSGATAQWQTIANLEGTDASDVSASMFIV